MSLNNHRLLLMTLIRKDQFTGINNIASPERLPEGAVADAVNLDFTVGGKAEKRTGYELLRECEEGKELRAVFTLPDGSLALIENDELLRFSHGTEQKLANISKGTVAATIHNNKLYLQTPYEGLEVSNLNRVSSWYESNPDFDLADTQGYMPAGSYRIGVTKLFNNKESGCNIIRINTRVEQGIKVILPQEGRYRVYCSVADGSTLYYQGEAAGEFSLTVAPMEDTERLANEFLTPLPVCEMLESYQSLIVGAADRFLFFTRPMQPHLHHPAQDYLQFPDKITAIASVADGVYVCADKTYFISALGSSEMMQMVVLDFGAIQGTQVRLPDLSVSWFSEYGQVLAGLSGQVRLLNQNTFSPDTADSGAAGFIEHNGNQMITTVMRGKPQRSKLKSTDFWDIEVI